MKNKETPPGEKQREKAAEPESTDGKDPSVEPGSASKENEPEQEKEQNRGKPSEEELISRWRDPITNQAEQDKITNAEGDDIPVSNT